jgi:hypothetical protein
MTQKLVNEWKTINLNHFWFKENIGDRLYDGARMKRIAAGENTVLKS